MKDWDYYGVYDGEPELPDESGVTPQVRAFVIAVAVVWFSFVGVVIAITMPIWLPLFGLMLVCHWVYIQIMKGVAWLGTRTTK